MKYMDKTLSPAERAVDLLERMTLEEKIEQLSGYFLKGEAGLAAEKQVHECRGEIEITLVTDTAQELKDMIVRVQNKIMEASRFQIPALVHTEAISGGVFSQATSYPSSIAQASTWDTQAVHTMADCIRKELLAVGFRHVLSPVFDICRDPRWGRMTETYGEDETLAAAMSVAFVSGIQNDRKQNAIAATGKHFVGHGITENGINMAQNNITDRELMEVHCKPFQAAISEAGLMTVMNSYCSINREAVTASRRLLTELLREELGFDGLVVSDYYSINRLIEPFRMASTPLEAGIMALKAGMNIEYPVPFGFSKDLIRAVEDNRVDETLIEDSVRRLLEIKFQLGLFENPYPQGTVLGKNFRGKKCGEISRKLAKESIILLKNERNVLPLDRGQYRIAVIGPHADRIRPLFGGYTYASMIDLLEDDKNNNHSVTQNSGENMSSVYQRFAGDLRETPLYVEKKIREMYPEARTLYEALKEYAPECRITRAQGISYTGNNTAGYEEALNLAAKADVIILTLGGQNGWGVVGTNGEGIDNSNIDLPGKQEQFARDVYALNKKTIVVHMDGRPLINQFVNTHYDAILEAWQPGEYGFQELVKLIFGDSNPSGKLPVTAATSADVLPAYYGQPRGSGYRNFDKPGTYGSQFAYVNTDIRPAYCFGHGLSYTNFEYTDLVLDSKKVCADGVLTISADIKNVGERFGEEVVQLYISDEYASVVRPDITLAGFARVGLQPGERKNVSFSVRMTQLAFLDDKMNWKVEGGAMKVLIGASSDDIRLTGEFEILGDQIINPRTRGFYTIGRQFKEERTYE